MPPRTVPGTQEVPKEYSSDEGMIHEQRLEGSFRVSWVFPNPNKAAEGIGYWKYCREGLESLEAVPTPVLDPLPW